MRSIHVLLVCVIGLLSLAGCCGSAAKPQNKTTAAISSRATTAAIPDNELRGIFVSTAYNLDWPSQPGLPANVQQNEIDAIILRAEELNCNTIFLQVRSFGDRIYLNTNPTRKESWSESLNNFQDPGYDPLGIWITKAHENGLQLIAWVNPFRTDWALMGADGKVLPFYVSANGEHLWLDPTSSRVQDYVVGVIEDLLDNYRNSPSTAQPMMHMQMRSASANASGASSQPGGGGGDGSGDDDGLDGVVVDHYFPDPNDPGNARADFPAPIYAMMSGAPAPTNPTATTTTTLTKPKNKRIDWLKRHYNMPDTYQPVNEKTLDDFIQRIFISVDGRNRIFAISPSIDKPAQIPHAVNWLQKGWCHYFIPELYQHPKDFKPSLDGWIAQNTATGKKPLIVPALYSGAIEKPDSTGQLWPASDIEEELDYARSKGVGQVYYSWRVLKEHKHGGPPDNDNVGDHLKKNQYKEKSLIPEAKLPAGVLPAPTLSAGSPGLVKVKAGTGSGRIRTWAYKTFGPDGWSGWQTALGKETSLPLGDGTQMKVRAIDRHNRQSADADYP